MALLILCDPVWFKSSRLCNPNDQCAVDLFSDGETHFNQILAPPAYSVNLSASYKLDGLFMYVYMPSNSFQNSGSCSAVLCASSSSARESTSASATYWPPKAPNLPSGKTVPATTLDCSGGPSLSDCSAGGTGRAGSTWETPLPLVSTGMGTGLREGPLGLG